MQTLRLLLLHKPAVWTPKHSRIMLEPQASAACRASPWADGSAAVQQATTRHNQRLLLHTQVYVTVDTDSDGRADTARTFITGLDHPNGVVWHNGSLFVMTATHLVRYDDVDRLALSGQVIEILGLNRPGDQTFRLNHSLPLKVR